MHSIFKTAILNGHDCVILSAYGNQPKHVASLFKQVIEEGKYDKNNKEGNVKIFNQTVCT